ncbi:MAG: SelB C-terminal domain-containing protein, partial [candidate division WOR-3 bacterium]
GVLVDIGDGILMHSQALQSAEQVLKDMFKTQPEVTASQYRQALGTTRKIVIPLLNYFDRIGLTQRKGDVRVLRRK